MEKQFLINNIAIKLLILFLLSILLVKIILWYLVVIPLISVLLSFVIITPVIVFLSVMYLDIVITKETISYKLFPINLNYKIIHKTTIKTISFNKLKVMQFGGFGLRSAKRGLAYIVEGENYIEIELNDNKRIYLSILNKKIYENFMNT
jgi:hypothetical protein